MIPYKALHHLLFFTLFFLLPLSSHGQKNDYSIELEALDIQEVGGLQSYAFGQSDGKWLIIGGRLDGLHRRQPFAAFDEAGHNRTLMVIDPIQKKKWTSETDQLPIAISEQLHSTNMQFFQDGNHLILVGGYGITAQKKEHVTYDRLTVVQVRECIDAIIQKKPIESYFKQISAPFLAVTGGKLSRIDQRFYLIGGHLFEGQYNPMGPENGPGFIQEYSNSIRSFQLLQTAKGPKIEDYQEVRDTVLLHRRDYNMLPQMTPNGEEALQLFSGVFQYEVDLPYHSTVFIDSKKHQKTPGFRQFYSHYHCPVIPIYSSNKGEMHHLFLGGIAHYYDSSGVLVQEENVPFVRSISRIIRNRDGRQAEFLFKDQMPALLGAGGEFILAADVPKYRNGVIKMDELRDGQLLGYIYGGIASTEKNILFFHDEGNMSQASKSIFKVLFRKNPETQTWTFNPSSTSPFNLELFPRAHRKKLDVSFQLQESVPIQITIKDEQGKIRGKYRKKNPLGSGSHELSLRIRKMDYGSKYHVYIQAGKTSYERILIVED
ncbi:MAG: T9SS C-terminal target domain-containing protein [Bacteroidetes bacterium]|nr:MAG: T9SS C-terminal target domain-containing protein [Bacteroidota bacterium]